MDKKRVIERRIPVGTAMQAGVVVEYVIWTRCEKEN